METISAKVTRKDRAGRAPYNFVPLPDKWRSAEKPPDGDCYHKGHLTGEIHFSLTALTDFYTRGMWSLDEFQKQAKDKQNEQPFQVNGRLRLPGSSIRGMIRTLVEILSGAPLDPINDTQLFFRAVASVADPENKSSFEPQAHEYKRRLLYDNQLVVQAGYLYAGWVTDEQGDHKLVWKIHPATTDPETGRQWYRYRTLDKWLARKIRFDPEGEFARVSPTGTEAGWLVCSGPIPRKTKQWVIREQDPNSDPLTIGDDLVQAYKENGATRELKGKKFEYTDRTQGFPCFYTMEGATITGFGHTGYFRMPYRNKPKDAIPPGLCRTKERESEWDFAQALFGRSEKAKAIDGARTRVFFEDAIHTDGPGDVQSAREVVLGQPKPTTYQHYLVQPDDQLSKMHHWDGDYLSKGIPVLRGHKLYWHRTGLKLPDVQGGKENVTSKICPATKGAVFSARVRFENLRPEELGALLTALVLPKDHAHHLGMGKPLGLGSFRIDLRGVWLKNPHARYSSFINFTKDGPALAHGLTLAPPQACIGFQKAFFQWYEPGLSRDGFWGLDRFRELKAMLTCGEQQHGSLWWNMTRYLEFGPTEDGRNYNEYTHVGYPQRKLEKRRPLPRASQVLAGGANIPDDPWPGRK